jgi:hypothetical protein
MPRMTRRLRCYTGPLDAETDGLIVVYTQRQAVNLLKIGKKKFTEKWRTREMPEWAVKFTVYVCRPGDLTWNPREES